MIASDLIDDAIQKAIPYIAPQRISKAQLFKSLAGLNQTVIQEISQLAPDVLKRRSGSKTVVASQNASGYKLEEGILYSDFKYIFDSGYTVPITIVNYADLERLKSHPAGALSGSKYFIDTMYFFPSDPAERGWAGGSGSQLYWTGDGDSFSYTYVPAPSQLTSLDEDLSAPTIARAYLTSSLTLDALLAQPEGVPEARIQKAMQEVQENHRLLTMQAMKMVPKASRDERRYP